MSKDTIKRASLACQAAKEAECGYFEVLDDDVLEAWRKLASASLGVDYKDMESPFLLVDILKFVGWRLSLAVDELRDLKGKIDEG